MATRLDEALAWAASHPEMQMTLEECIELVEREAINVDSAVVVDGGQSDMVPEENSGRV